MVAGTWLVSILGMESLPPATSLNSGALFWFHIQTDTETYTDTHTNDRLNDQSMYFSPLFLCDSTKDKTTTLDTIHSHGESQY